MGSIIGKRVQSLIDLIANYNTLHIVMLGLDSAGKTTALYRLKFDQYLNTVPTIGFNCEKVKLKNGKAKGTSFLIWDIGGQDKLRPLWRSYTRCTDGIIFVIDSVDEERLEEAKMELIRTARAPENSRVPILVLANKQDLPGAKDADQMARVLGLNDLNGKHLWHVQSSCSVIGDGLEDGLHTLYDLIVQQKRLNKSSKNKR